MNCLIRNRICRNCVIGFVALSLGCAIVAVVRHKNTDPARFQSLANLQTFGLNPDLSTFGIDPERCYVPQPLCPLIRMFLGLGFNCTEIRDTTNDPSFGQPFFEDPGHTIVIHFERNGPASPSQAGLAVLLSDADVSLLSEASNHKPDIPIRTLTGNDIPEAIRNVQARQAVLVIGYRTYRFFNQ